MRVGDTVRRPVRPWTDSVDAVLRHLEAIGFTAAPRPLGRDSEGRQVVEWIEGDDGRASTASDGAVFRVGSLVRELHRALAGFEPPPGSVWVADPSAPTGVLVCHNDLSPANTVFRGGLPVAFIDWELARPTTAAWDLAYAARTFAPLYSDDDCASMGYRPEDRGTRLRLFCDGYGLTAAGRADVLDVIGRRLATQSSAFAARSRAALAEHGEEWRRALR